MLSIHNVSTGLVSMTILDVEIRIHDVMTRISLSVLQYNVLLHLQDPQDTLNGNLAFSQNLDDLTEYIAAAIGRGIPEVLSGSDA